LTVTIQAKSTRIAGKRPWTSHCEDHEGVTDGPPAIHVKDGASAWWSLIQIRNAPAAVRSITWESPSGASGEFEWATESENFFSVPEQVRESSQTITLTLHFSFDITITHALIGSDLTVENALIEIGG
jgi:hypothetical protein